jgi:serine/threonine protein kinase
MKKFPINDFDKSCLIYTKGEYGIFLLRGIDENYYTAKIKYFGFNYGAKLDNEDEIALYLKANAKNMPNLLVPEEIYYDNSPIEYLLFTDKSNRLLLSQCKDATLDKIFIHSKNRYSYYITKAGLYNLGYYLGTYKGVLSYETFIGFSFQILAGLQVLHSLGIWHRDIKPQNILIFESDKNTPDITYKYRDKKWTIKYPDLLYRELKIIDYGESQLNKDVITPCKTFQYETSVAVVNVMQIMWNKVTNKEDKNKEEYFQDLIFLLKNCETHIIDVISNAKIYKNLSENETTNNEYILF